jgi:S-adenosyl-L-methionine hydrolase (adenosine-forming)
MGIVTLLTDFGLRDEYVGVMKGVILSVDPNAVIVDITHEIPPQDVRSAAYLLPAYPSFFPAGTVHVAVVDPGVGSERAILAVKWRGRYFLAPDNGLLTFILDGVPEAIVRVENREYFLHPVSRTFHGRDIFAPVAARLSAGLPIENLGPCVPAGNAARLKIAKARRSPGGGVTGAVVSVDRFGNLITNIDAGRLDAVYRGSGMEAAALEICGRRIEGLNLSYEKAAEGDPLLIVGSRGCLEIAVCGGDAAKVFGAGPGTRVRLLPPDRS